MKHADACRAAGLAFAWGHASWGKSELAHWLAGPYTSAVFVTSAVATSAITPRATITHERIRDLLDRSYRHVAAVLRTWPTWAAADFAPRVLAAGLVVATREGIRPASPPDMRLVDRVSSLFIADYLARPATYERFSVCATCDRVSFERACAHERAA